jgi:hypothetical protein
VQALVERFGVPLCPEPDVDQGDPYLVEAPAGSGGRFRYHVYVSGTGFPVYGSDDLVGWTSIGHSLAAEGDAWCWAPCVRHVPGATRPWAMLYSRARGAGEVDGHRDHRIRRADSESPEGPFVDSGEVLTPDLDFAIDPDVHVLPDGSPRLAFAADYVETPPYGTGLVEAGITPDLRRLTTPPQPVARASSEWQLYDPARSMPWKSIPGVDWAAGDTVRWFTMEGPVALVSPGGRRTMLYSGGNFAGFYGIGVLQQDAAGRWVDLSPTAEDCLLAPMPKRGVHGPGHCSVLETDDPAGGRRQLLCFHFRTGPDRPRQFGILPLAWDAADRPYCPVETGP